MNRHKQDNVRFRKGFRVFGRPCDPAVPQKDVGRSKTVTKNARGQVLYVEDAGTGDDNVAVNAKMGFYYDLAGNRVKKMDLNSTSMDGNVPAGLFTPGVKDTSGHNIACWQYDGFGRLIAASDPDLGYMGYSRNGFGDIVSQTDALNRTTVMSYDRAGRLAEKLLPNSEGVVYYTYDGIAGSDNGKGRLVAVDDPAQRKVLSYDLLGRTKKETRYFKNLESGIADLDKAYETLYTHDLLNRVTEIQYPVDPRGTARVTVSYRYMAAGVNRISTAYDGGSRDIVSSVSYNEFGQMTSMTRGNNVTTSYEYDIKGRLTHLLSTTYTNEIYSSIQDVNYTFKVDNSIAQIENVYDMGTDTGSTLFRHPCLRAALPTSCGSPSAAPYGIPTPMTA